MEEWRPSEKDGDPRTNRNYFKKQKHMLPLKGVCVCVCIHTYSGEGGRKDRSRGQGRKGTGTKQLTSGALQMPSKWEYIQHSKEQATVVPALHSNLQSVPGTSESALFLIHIPPY
jgi:hypothetical protein